MGLRRLRPREPTRATDWLTDWPTQWRGPGRKTLAGPRGFAAFCGLLSADDGRLSRHAKPRTNGPLAATVKAFCENCSSSTFTFRRATPFQSPSAPAQRQPLPCGHRGSVQRTGAWLGQRRAAWVWRGARRPSCPQSSAVVGLLRRRCRRRQVGNLPPASYAAAAAAPGSTGHHL